jgi:PAS domain S-box-containing protein
VAAASTEATAGWKEPQPLSTGPAQPIAVITMDLAGVVRDLNPEAVRVTGYARADAIGVPLAELIIPERLRNAHEAGLRRFRDRGEGPVLDHRIEVPLRRRDGTEILIELTITQVADRNSTDGVMFTGLLRPVDRPAAVPAELHLSEGFYRALVNHAPFLITILDSNGNERWNSPLRATLMGAPVSASATAHLRDLVHPADQSTARDALSRALVDGLAEPVELRLRAHDGSWRAVSFLAVNLDDDPAVHGTVFYGQDITRARAAERQSRVEAARMNILIESLGVGVLLQDEQGHVVLSNSAFVEMFSIGLGPDRLRGTALRADSGGYADREAVRRRTDETMDHGRPVIGQELTLTDGRVVERDYMPVTMDGATLGHLWVFRDITAQADIRRGLEERNRILTELSGLKTEFVTMVSHELRTPLTSIATFVSMVDDESLTAQDRHQAMSAIRRNTGRMLALVADLVMLAKLESGEIVFGSDEVDLADLIRQTCVDQATEPTSHALTVKVSDGGSVVGDRRLLRQAVDTVVGVVAASGDPGTPVTVDAHAVPGSWTLVVSTPTAEPASTERLLSTRLPHPEEPGEWRTGTLALMLTRQIAARHHGHLAISVDGSQIAVTLRLPSGR